MNPVFKRWFLPGFAFKAMVIGGGYSTGRELAEFFLPSGPWGGLFGMVLAMVLWSVICPITFLLARITQSYDYGTFFRRLLGPGAIAFDAAYFCFVMVLLSVFAAAAGSIGHALFGWSELVGVLALAMGIATVTAFGNESVESLFKYVTLLLYGVYALFLMLSLASFSHLIGTSFATARPIEGWAIGGVTYTGYNVIGAVIVLPVLRHLTSNRDAIVAGLLCGPLGMAPAIVFFVCMAAFYPQIGAVALPSDFMLSRLNVPAFHILFQVMIFGALLESGTASVHAVNERLAHLWLARGRMMTPPVRFALSGVVLVISIFVADRYGLVTLIAKGYRLLSYVFLAVYVLPVMTVGVWRVFDWNRNRCPSLEARVDVVS
jgi:uncharacterized membrane protein YkvI